MENALAIATVILALATVWMVFEIRQGRREATRATARLALRGAFIEQMENARRLRELDPKGRDVFQIQALRDGAPAFERTWEMLRSVDLPAELSGYLLWLAGDTQRAWDELLRDLKNFVTNVPNEWLVLLEDIQIVAELCAAELNRRGSDNEAAVARDVNWMQPQVWTTGRGSRQISQGVAVKPVEFPKDKAYAEATPGRRDERALAAAAPREAKLMAAAETIRPPQ